MKKYLQHCFSSEHLGTEINKKHINNDYSELKSFFPFSHSFEYKPVQKKIEQINFYRPAEKPWGLNEFHRSTEVHPIPS